MAESSFGVQAGDPPAPRPPLGQAFLDLALTGLNDGWRYVVGLLLLVMVSQVIGAALMIAVLGRSLGELGELLQGGELKHGPSLRLFTAVNLGTVGLLIAVCLVVRLVHDRGLLTLLTPWRRFSVKRLLEGCGWWFLLQGVSLGLAWVLDPSGGRFHPDLVKLWPFAALALVLTPLQIAGEELTFRGYFLQGLGWLTRRPLPLCLLSGLLFMLPHLANPEMNYGTLPMALTYGALGMFLALITLRDNRLELALGVHLANNLFAIVVAHPEVSALPTPSLFTVRDVDPWPSLAVFLVVALAFYLLAFRQGSGGGADPSRNAASSGEPGIDC